jgi:chromosome segregation ATPase
MELEEVKTHIEAHRLQIVALSDKVETIEKRIADAEHVEDVEIDMQDEAVVDLIVKITERTAQVLEPVITNIQKRIDELEKNYAANIENTGKLVNGYLATINEAKAKCEDSANAFDAVANKLEKQNADLSARMQEITEKQEEADKYCLFVHDSITKRQAELDAKMNQITNARNAFFAILYKKVSRKLVCDIFDISYKTLAQWVDDGKIGNATTSKGVVQPNLFVKDDVIRVFLEGNYAINPKRFK